MGRQIPSASGAILDPIVPHLNWIHDWDRYERLRRGLAEAFVKFSWPEELIRDCVKSDELLDRILQSSKRVNGGYEYFRRTRAS